VGLRSGGFGAKPKEMPSKMPVKGDDKGMPEGKHIHIHSHGGKIHSHSTDEHGMQMDQEHANGDEAGEHVKDFLNEGEQQSSGDDNIQSEPTRHFGLMA
jgi:hypothetical protein